MTFDFFLLYICLFVYFVLKYLHMKSIKKKKKLNVEIKKKKIK